MTENPERDALMRITGELKGAIQLLEGINVPHDCRRVRDLVETGQNTIRKAMLAAWEAAEEAKPVRSQLGKTEKP